MMFGGEQEEIEAIEARRSASPDQGPTPWWIVAHLGLTPCSLIALFIIHYVLRW